MVNLHFWSTYRAFLDFIQLPEEIHLSFGEHMSYHKDRYLFLDNLPIAGNVHAFVCISDLDDAPSLFISSKSHGNQCVIWEQLETNLIGRPIGRTKEELKLENFSFQDILLATEKIAHKYNFSGLNLF